VHIEPYGFLRLLTPLLAIRTRRTAHRLTDRMIELVEGEAEAGPADGSRANPATA